MPEDRVGLTCEIIISEVLKRGDGFSDAEIREFWYDWFCKETSLANKGRRLLQRLRTIAPSPRFDPEKTYVFFKNNCPCNGSLYDDFRICDKKTGDVLFCVTPAEGYTRTKGRSVVWGNDPNTGEFGQIVVGTWKDVKEFFHADEPRAKQIAAECVRFSLIEEAEWHNKEFDRQVAHAKWEAQWKEDEANRAQRQADQEHCDRLDYMFKNFGV